MEISSNASSLSLLIDRPPHNVEGAISKSPTPLRFVPLPTENERSPTAGFVVATSKCVRLDLAGRPLDQVLQGELLGVLIALLQRYSQQANIALDLFVHHPAGEWAVALDADITADSTVPSIIDELGLGMIAPAARASRAIAQPSNVAATLILAPTDLASLVDQGVAVSSLPAAFDVNFTLAQIDGAIALVLIYNGKLFSAAIADRLVDSYATLFGAELQGPATAIELLPLLGPAEINALTAAQDSGTVPYPPTPVHRLFEALAQRQPAAVACSFQGRNITYAELNQHSNKLAHYLASLGVGPDIPVAVCVRPSIEIMVAMLAIWKARGVYLPLDPTHPEGYIGRLLAEAQPRIVLTTAALSGLTPGFPRFCFDTDAALLEALPSAALPGEPKSTDTAYILYTSGTTGKPKGVVATHANLVQYVHSAVERYGVRSDDIFASVARYTFVISMFELLTPLCRGGGIRILDRDEVLTPERLCRALEQVTVLHCGPSLMGSLFRYIRATPSAPRTLPRMRHASMGGDLAPPSVIEEMKQVFPNAELFIIYGCTEVTCMGTTYPIRREVLTTRNFVGKPFPNVVVRVLDANRNLVPFGVLGEICFAGAGIVRGYLDMPELTAEKFAEIDGIRFYRTGDLGRLHDDGNIEILGRRDFQVQLRGIRIELASIEKNVLELGLAVQCAVIAKTMDEGDVRLVAFIVKPSDNGIRSFRRTLARVLPDYMLPHHVVVLEAMPLTANGKLDRNRLKDLPWERQLVLEARTAPANPREQKIAEAFAQVLDLDVVGVDDNFFDLGGDSLLGVVLLEDIKNAIGVEIPPYVLFESGTVRAFADHPQSSGPEEPRPILLNRITSAPPLFMLSGIHIYRELAKRLEGVCSAYGVAARHETEAFESVQSFWSVEDLATEYCKIIRRQQPKGPYRLLGYSFAGLAAYEVARQFREAGDEVCFLALVDPDLEWVMGWRFRLAQIARLRSAPLRDVLRFLRRRFLEKSGANFHGLLRYREHKKLAELEEKRNTVNRASSAAYFRRIRPWPDDVILITSGERLRNEPLKGPDCGWGRYIRSLEIHPIDADHFRMMSDDPYVSEIAEILALGLTAQRSSADRSQSGPGWLPRA